MMISCGKTQEGKDKEYEAKMERLHKWHSFFAIWPRMVAAKDGRKVCTFLQRIERKGRYTYVGVIEGPGGYWNWEYRLARSRPPFRWQRPAWWS